MYMTITSNAQPINFNPIPQFLFLPANSFSAGCRTKSVSQIQDE